VDIIGKNELKALSSRGDGLHVSVFAPTVRAGSEVQQNPLRLKNLLNAAEERLVDAGLRRPEAVRLLEPARGLLDRHEFWKQQAEGLAVFVSVPDFYHYRLPIAFEELVVVADRFHTKPLLPLLSGDGRFLILAISQNDLRLLLGSRFYVGEVDLEGIPTSLAEVLRYDDPERDLQFHTTTRTPGGAGDRPALFHGQGVSSDEDKTEILRYFQQVDRGMSEFLAGERVPLVLAGVDYLLPIYQDASSYAHLLPDGVEGNPELLSAEELHREAWAVVQPYLGEQQTEAVKLYQQLADSPQASNALEEVVAAAYFERVDTLFVALGEQVWGTLDPETGQVETRPERRDGDEDLLDLAAVHTLTNGGTVYAIEPDRVPGGGLLAAVFRY
jgi:hypothetical protein